MDAGRGSVKQLIVLAVVKSLFERGTGEDGDGFELGGDVGGLAQAVEVECETVADIHAGGGAAEELAAEFETGSDHRFVTPAAEGAGHIKDIVRFGGGAPEGFAFGGGAGERDIDGELAGVGEIATGKRYFVFFQNLIDSAIETCDPDVGSPRGQSEGDEAIFGGATAGGDVAQGAGDGAVTDGFGRGFPREVDAFDAHVGLEEQVAVGAGGGDDGAVVADQGGGAAEAGEDLVFGQRFVVLADTHVHSADRFTSQLACRFSATLN